MQCIVWFDGFKIWIVSPEFSLHWCDANFFHISEYQQTTVNIFLQNCVQMWKNPHTSYALFKKITCHYPTARIYPPHVYLRSVFIHWFHHAMRSFRSPPLSVWQGPLCYAPSVVFLKKQWFPLNDGEIATVPWQTRVLVFLFWCMISWKKLGLFILRVQIWWSQRITNAAFHSSSRICPK